MTYGAPGAPELAAKVKALMPDPETVAEEPDRGLDHGAYVPLMVMFPRGGHPGAADVHADAGPAAAVRDRRAARPLRDDGVLIDRLRLHHPRPAVPARLPARRAAARLVARSSTCGPRRRSNAGDVDALLDFRARARHAVRAPDRGALRAAVRHARRGERPRASPDTTVEGYFLGLAKRSFQVDWIRSERRAEHPLSLLSHLANDLRGGLTLLHDAGALPGVVRHRLQVAGHPSRTTGGEKSYRETGRPSERDPHDLPLSWPRTAGRRPCRTRQPRRVLFERADGGVLEALVEDPGGPHRVGLLRRHDAIAVLGMTERFIGYNKASAHPRGLRAECQDGGEPSTVADTAGRYQPA